MQRFSLGKLIAVCPRCGRRTFKPYIDNATGQPLDAACGRCNREVNCRYHLPPSQWFAAGGHAAPAPGGWTPPPPPPPDFVTLPRQNVERLHDDTLFNFLCRHFARERVADVFQRYHVTHAYWHGGATTFPLVDAEGHCRSAKLMRYGTDGHRIKSDNPVFNVTYLHSLLGLKPFSYRACFFGEHLAAARPDKRLCLVESEKTALVMAIADGDDRMVYMATGGASALRPRPEILADPYGRFAPLRGRDVLLYPDADMMPQWKAAGDALATWCRTVTLGDVTAPPYGLTASRDIADYILDTTAPPVISRRCI